jgi:hypothetical protein
VGNGFAGKLSVDGCEEVHYSLGSVYFRGQELHPRIPSGIVNERDVVPDPIQAPPRELSKEIGVYDF